MRRRWWGAKSNDKSEIRKPRSERNPKSEARNPKNSQTFCLLRTQPVPFGPRILDLPRKSRWLCRTAAKLFWTSRLSDIAFPLTPALSPWEREQAGPPRYDNDPALFATPRTTIPPLPEGEGRGEGEGDGRPVRSCELDWAPRPIFIPRDAQDGPEPSFGFRASDFGFFFRSLSYKYLNSALTPRSSQCSRATLRGR